MTHGVGGFSSGGGGGFSGGGSCGSAGGFSGGSGFYLYTHHHQSGKARRGKGCKCCCYFMVCGISILGFLFCIRKMSRIIRIALLWTYVAIAVLTVSLLVSAQALGTNKFQSAPTDMRRIDDNVNNAFCDSLKINSTDPFHAYSFDNAPVVDPHQIEQFNTTYSMLISSNNYEYWGFYFLEGSTLTVDASGGAIQFVIKGRSNLQAWIDSEGTCSGCYIDKTITFPPYTYKLTVTERDDYYFMYFSKSFTLSTRADFYVKRTLFDVSTATSNCSFHKGDNPCQFDLSLSSSQNVVFHNGRTATKDQSIDMWSTCHPRVWMYFTVFVFITALLAIAVTFLFWKFCKDEKSQESAALLQDPDEDNKKFPL